MWQPDPRRAKQQRQPDLPRAPRCCLRHERPVSRGAEDRPADRRDHRGDRPRPGMALAHVGDRSRDAGRPRHPMVDRSETTGRVTCPPRTGPSTELENLCRCGRRGRGMSKRKRYAAEEIIAKLREAEVHLAQGDTVGQAVRKLEVSKQTYYRWRREYGGMRSGMVTPRMVPYCSVRRSTPRFPGSSPSSRRSSYRGRGRGRGGAPRSRRGSGTHASGSSSARFWETFRRCRLPGLRGAPANSAATRSSPIFA